MRAARLVALLLELQRRGRATAPELADELEVSVRTVYRDVASLQAAGVPLWTETGPQGGIRLLEGWRTDLDGLTGDEAMALALSGAPGAADALGLGTMLVVAETKVRAALPPELRARSERVRERFHLDAPGWFRRPDDTTWLGPLADAVWSDRRIEVGYERADRTVHRTLDPLGLVLKAGIWYLVARHRGQLRTYRVGRIRSLEVRSDTFERPADFVLANHWQASAQEFDRTLLRYRCELRLSPAAVWALPHVVDAAAAHAAIEAAGPPDAEGWRALALSAESEEVAASQLVGLGGGVEVLAPEGLRRRLAALGAEIAARNAER